MIAAETIFANLERGLDREFINYETNIKNSWLWKDLYKVRNIRPAFHRRLIPGLAYSALDTYIFHGHAPWTFNNHADYKILKPANECKKIDYPKSDNKITFDKLSSVDISNTHHNENQLCHLQLKNPEVAIGVVSENPQNFLRVEYLGDFS